MTDQEPATGAAAEPDPVRRPSPSGSPSGSAGGSAAEAAGRPARPSPAPVSPASRARRAAAAGVQPALRRPSPTPSPDAPSPAASSPGSPSPAAPSPRIERDGPGAERTEVRTEPLERLAAESEPAAGDRIAHRVRASSPLWLALVLVAIIAVAGGASWWLAANSDPAGSVSQRDQALSAAKSSVPLILSYSYQDFDASVRKADAELTGRAGTDYLTAMNTTIKAPAIKAKLIVAAQTDTAGVESVSADGTQVTVVVFGEQKVTNSSLSTPRIDPFRVRATMDLVAGHWKVAKFDQL